MYYLKTELVTKIAYMIGLRKDLLETRYDEDNHELLQELYQNQSATTIRYLCKLRTKLMQYFKKTNDAMYYDLKNLDTIEWFDSDNIMQLSKWGINIVKPGYRAEQYLVDISTLINQKIGECKDLFYDWQNWDYIKDLFMIPKCTDPNAVKAESVRFQNSMQVYPFQMYIHWTPHDCGNMLESDKKFLSELFTSHGDIFEDYERTTDATEETKCDVYDFINEYEKTIIVVDCENSDVYKLASVLKNLEADELKRINKILLFDDYHQNVGWDYLQGYTQVPVEHIEVERVMDSKSQVDMALAVACCKEHYTNKVDSFILFSSDSDYWALISALEDVGFLVMYEDEKVSQATKNILWENGYSYTCIDDFCTGNTEDFQKMCMVKTIAASLPDLSQLNANDILTKALTDTRLDYTKQDYNNYYQKYLKNIKVKIKDDGTLHFEIG